MISTNKEAQGAATPRALNKLTKQSKLKPETNKPAKKIHRIMGAFARGESLNFIEAQRLYHDRSLHSTVSEIQTDYQIMIARETETISGFMGLPTRCRRYWIEPDQREKARKILGVSA